MNSKCKIISRLYHNFTSLLLLYVIRSNCNKKQDWKDFQSEESSQVESFGSKFINNVMYLILCYGQTNTLTKRIQNDCIALKNVQPDFHSELAELLGFEIDDLDRQTDWRTDTQIK